MLERAGMVFVRDEDEIRIDLLLADIEFDRHVVRRALAVEVLPGILARVHAESEGRV